ncbi:hypothetical protein L1S32_09395 [Methanogenium sp. S4BF]|uniref:hypothetical protein n=1 Tax=Methanogenium sp. S4BF TaxID=1789226 RepID=UPI002416361F|nr:hypothetical protein [Methanogenium sp. S4BF]WFN34056.1 hypothetical protein L1S32_09395 [Methanogenium sp. S4BF]
MRPAALSLEPERIFLHEMPYFFKKNKRMAKKFVFPLFKLKTVLKNSKFFKLRIKKSLTPLYFHWKVEKLFPFLKFLFIA